MIIHYNPKLKQLARNLRNNSSISEICFWNQVKAKQMRDYRFLRQKPIGNYIVDFFCSKLYLVIEIDGESHLGQEKADMKKQHYLEGIGLTVLRFDNDQIKYDMDGVLIRIDEWIEQRERS